MKKKILALILSAVMLTFSAVSAYAEEENKFLDNMSCESAILMEENTGKILLSKNIEDRKAPASITKIMTMLLIMEEIEKGNISEEDMIRTSANAKIMGGSEIFLAEGEEMSLKDMLKGIAVASANDAAVAVAEYISGTEEAFVEKMNKRAKELNMDNTHYVNCHGLDEENHYTCAKDVATVTRELMKHEKIKDYTTIWMDSLRNGATELVNTNRLIRFYRGATGLKTGTTENAGHCLSATAERDGLKLIAVVMGCKTGKDRFSEASEILDYGFANYMSCPLPSSASEARLIPVLGGSEEFVRGFAQTPESIFTEKSRKNDINVQVEICDKLTAPVEKNQILGRVKIMQGDDILSVYPIYAEKEVKRRTFPESFGFMWKKICELG